jgi:large subunit ribosomal protein L5
MEPRLKQKYKSEVVPELMEEFSYHTPMQVPKVEKVVLHIGLGEAISNPKAIEEAESDLTTISGQKPILRRAKRSISQFKLREGMLIGMMVTLRGNRMYYFLDKLFNAVLPRIRDFGGVAPGSFDGQGNYSLGLKDQTIFPEIDYGKVGKVRGLQITIVTTAQSGDKGRRLLSLLGMPFSQHG